MLKMPHTKNTIAAAVSMSLLGVVLHGPVLAQTTTTNAIGSSTVNAISSGSGDVNATGSTTINAATVNGSGTAASGSTAPTTSSTTSPAPTGSTTTAPSGTGTTAPSATASSTSTANATATNDIDFYIVGGTVGTTPPGGVTVTGDNNVIGNNNNTITGNNNAISSGSTTTATTAGTGTQNSALSGSSTSSLQQGLRNGTTVTLTGAGETATFTPPTGRMGNGEADRAVTLAKRDLASAGISNPTPTQLQAALMGGTVTNAQGQTTSMEGVLQLREQGMGWGNIAQTIGVHPAQSEQGATNSRRGGSNGNSIAGSGNRDPRSSQALARDSGQNQIARDGRTAAAGNISDTDTRRDRGTVRSQSAQSKGHGSDNSVVASIGGRSNDRSRHSLSATDSASAKIGGPSNPDGRGAKNSIHAASKGKNGPGAASDQNRNSATPGVIASGEMTDFNGGRERGGIKGKGGK